MNEYDKPFFDVYRMFPEAVRRADILEGIKRFWPDIAKRAAGYSYPYNLGVNELCVQVTDTQAKGLLLRSKGSIARKIYKRFGYEFGKDFVLTLTDDILHPQPIPRKPVKNLAAGITITDDEVKQRMMDAPETLPEDINHAISSLQVFLEKIAAKESRK